jgi:hypothetical protein
MVWLALLIFPVVCNGFASWYRSRYLPLSPLSICLVSRSLVLTLLSAHLRMENDFCDRSFRSGEIVMNEVVVESDERSVEVYRGNKLLKSSDLYYPNEVLKLSLSEVSGDIIFQVENATIVGGGCQGTRTSKNMQMIKMPEEGGDAVVRIWAGESVPLT